MASISAAGGPWRTSAGRRGCRCSARWRGSRLRSYIAIASCSVSFVSRTTRDRPRSRAVASRWASSRPPRPSPRQSGWIHIRLISAGAVVDALHRAAPDDRLVAAHRPRTRRPAARSASTSSPPAAPGSKPVAEAGVELGEVLRPARPAAAGRAGVDELERRPSPRAAGGSAVASAAASSLALARRSAARRGAGRRPRTVDRAAATRAGRRGRGATTRWRRSSGSGRTVTRSSCSSWRSSRLR